MEEFFDRSIKVPVYYDRGAGFDGDPGRKRLTRAPFAVLKGYNGTTYLSTQPCQSASGLSLNTASIKDDLKQDAFFLSFDGEFYEDGERIIIGEHEMGNWNVNAASEGWKNLHKFSVV